MKKLLSMLIAATFAAVSFQALAAETKSETPRMEKKTKATKATKAKKHIVKKHSEKDCEEGSEARRDEEVSAAWRWAKRQGIFPCLFLFRLP